jgi:hypothetical protein
MDRRRRFLRENVEDGSQASPNQRRPSRKRSVPDNLPEASSAKKTAGYSQDVRKACGQRLVQLIPVRRRSFAAVVAVSLLVPSLLLTAHYLIYVSGQLPWYGHPLALTLDASHPRSIAAWLSSHLWLLCLATTVLTFQLRRHKLDDYNGDYRLWFWLVLTCLIASIDATTNITDLFGMALDPWSQINLGWSGPAVVHATLAVLIAMLGLRLCTELKAVPTSLIFWLLGLVAWAGSAALGRDELKVDLSVQFRIWLASALWLGGLTAIWLSALAYLRNTYIEAQRRFLLRGRLANHGVPLGQRLRESIPTLPSFRRKASEEDSHGEADPRPASSRWGLPTFMKRRDDSELKAVEAESAANVKQPAPTPEPKARESAGSRSAVEAPTTETNKARGLGGFLKRSTSETKVAENLTGSDTSLAPEQAANASTTKNGWTGWLRKPKDDGQAEEYRKLKSQASAESRSQNTASSTTETDESQPRRGWIPKLSRTKTPRAKSPATKTPKEGGIFSKIKLPKFKLPSLRLPPPGESDDEDSQSRRPSRPVDSNRALPSTQPNSPQTNSPSQLDSEEDDNSRPMSKAERKRLRRLQQQGKRVA